MLQAGFIMSNELRHWVRVTVIGIVIFIAAVDLLLLARYGARGTISYALRGWSEEFPILPYLIAFAFVYHIASH